MKLYRSNASLGGDGSSFIIFSISLIEISLCRLPNPTLVSLGKNSIFLENYLFQLLLISICMELYKLVLKLKVNICLNFLSLDIYLSFAIFNF